MEVNKNEFIEMLSNSIICPKDLGIKYKCNEIATIDNCKECWSTRLKGVEKINLVGGIEECQK